MKRHKITGVILALSILFLGQTVQAQNVQNFTIPAFNGQYVLTKDASQVSQLGVDEYILVRFPDFDQNHGILRALPLTYNDQALNLELGIIDKKVDELSPSTSRWPYSTTKENDNLVLKIGDPEIFSKGLQNFHITYTMHNVVRDYDSYQELFWNVNGTQWQQSISTVTAKITLPAEIAKNTLNEPKCFTGALGSTQQNCSITSAPQADGSKIITTSSAEPLAPGQNLSFVIGFAPGTFTVKEPSFLKRFLPIISALLVVLLPLLAFIFILFRWRKYGRDPELHGTIVPEYQPPKDDTLVLHEFVLQESGSPKAITAQIINLAIRGYLRIIDTEKDAILGKKHDFSLEILKDVSALDKQEKKVVIMFFKDTSKIGDIVSINKLKNSLSSDVASLWKEVESESITKGYFKNKPRTTKQKYISLAIAFAVLAFMGFMFGGILGAGFGAGMLLSAIIVGIGAKYMPARTVKGVSLREYLLGLKLYIKTAEKDRIKFHQSPDSAERKTVSSKNPDQALKLFEDLLPYAMLFGLEKQWAKQFSDLYTAPPAWYGGSMNTFSTGYLVGSMGSFESAATSSFAAPASSGSSGFSGGGFSGGGGGGGGGGGW